jgi:hypothetical protein
MDKANWKIKINDGWSEYEYEYLQARGDISIHDISEVLKIILNAEITTNPKQISYTKILKEE